MKNTFVLFLLFSLISPAQAEFTAPAIKTTRVIATGVDQSAMMDVFRAPDEGTAYACTFHWFRTPDGRIVGLDLIRSDDTGKRALRAYIQDKDGIFRGMIHETTTEEWTAEKNGFTRGENWIIGSVKNDAGMRVAFDLNILPQKKGLGTGALGLRFANLVATDFTDVRIKGFLRIGEERFEIDSAGITSIHYGDKLPQAAYIATVPDGSQEPGILLAAASGDNLRVAGKLIGNRSIIYAYGSNGIAPLAFGIGRFDREIPLGAGVSLILTPMEYFEHTLLGEPTVTGTARATLLKPDPAVWPPSDWGRKKEIPLGTVIFDFRGAPYVKTLY